MGCKEDARGVPFRSTGKIFPSILSRIGQARQDLERRCWGLIEAFSVPGKAAILIHVLLQILPVRTSFLNVPGRCSPLPSEDLIFYYSIVYCSML